MSGVALAIGGVAGAGLAAAGVGATTAVLGGAAVAGAAGAGLAASRGASAAKSAAATQARAQDSAIAEQQRQFDTIRQILAPYVQAGSPELTQPYIQAGPGAIRGLQAIAGLGGEQARQQALFDVRQSPQFRQLADVTLQNVDEYTRNRAQELAKLQKQQSYINPSVTVGKGEDRALAIQQAQEDITAKFNQETDAKVRDLMSQGYAQQQALLKPVLESGKYDEMGRQMQEQAIQQIEQGPLFQQLAQQGEQAILANASATGGLRGGNVQAALGQFRPQLLNQLIEQQYARLSGLANVGQTGAQSLLGIGQASAAGQAASAGQAGNAISGLLASQGAARAAGQVGAAQAFAQGLSGVTGAIGGGIQNYMLLNALGSGGTGGGLFGGSGGFGQDASPTFMSTNVPSTLG
jgi:hypothetical protein